MIKVLISGAYGRMGIASCVAIGQDPELSLVAKVGSGDDLATSIIASQAQVVVDFSVPCVAFQNAKTIIENGACPVIGTSGFTHDNIKTLQDLAKNKNIGGIIAPNFSIAVALMLKYAKDASKYFPKAEIIEMHHDKKIDTPSGTAIKTAQLLQQQYNLEVPISSVRLPGIIADQQIIFGSCGETFAMHHRTIDRKSFMPGVILACKKVLQMHELVYGLEFLL